MFAVYASTDDKKMRDQWKLLSRKLEVAGDRCLVIGDYNDILDNLEKERGNYRYVASRRDFSEFIVDNRLLELGFVGYPVTWRNRRDDGPIQQRLDRGLTISEWVNVYPNARVLHEVLEGSDHSMLILDMDVMPLK